MVALFRTASSIWVEVDFLKWFLIYKLYMQLSCLTFFPSLLLFPFLNRLEVEKVVRDQASLEIKELVVLAVSIFFAFIVILKLVSTRVTTFLGATQFDRVCRTSRGWVLILVSSSMTIFITLLSS